MTEPQSASHECRRIVLASASTSRANLLTAAAVPFVADPSAIDEDAIKGQFSGFDDGAGRAALRLAEAKAEAVSERRPGLLVIGADQLLECDGVWFDKPASIDAARSHLRALRGRTHCLYTAVAVAVDGRTLWNHLAVPTLTMRSFSDAFLETYLDAGGSALLSSVGAYRLEAGGVQLFTEIDGDYFSILGLPLLPLLAFLRAAGCVAR